MGRAERPGRPPALDQVARRVEDHLTSVLAEERARWAAVDERLAEAVTELADHVLGGGKRLRAAFCYWAAVGAGAEEPPGVWDAAAAFELLQGFALIHDDVMDDADTRRGHATVHVRHARRLTDSGWRGEPRRYGEGVAILVGDLGHVYADRLVSGLPIAARRIWDELRIELNLGQYLDLRSAAAGDVDAATAAQVSRFKSALYTIVRPLQLGAALQPGCPAGLHAALARFGEPLGRAFQLRDDLLDVVGHTNRVGKPVGGDLRDGKATEVLALALAEADAEQRAVLARAGEAGLDAGAVAAMVSVLRDTGAVATVEERIDRLVDEAVDALHELPLTEAARAALSAIARYVGSRDR
jgi:geranylgeranyl diphosphate synthase type I